MARSFDRVLSIVTIRRIDGLAAGNDPEAILARAGAQLNASNLAAAESAVTDASLKTITALSATAAAEPLKAEPKTEPKAEQ